LLRGNQTEFFGPGAFVLDTNDPPFGPILNWMPNTGASQWIAPYPTVTTNDGIGQYVFRTYINMYEQDLASALQPSYRWSADDEGLYVRLNGVILNHTSGTPGAFSPYRFLSGLAPGLNVLDFFVEDQGDVEGLRVEVLSGVEPSKHASPRMTVRIGGTTYQVPVTQNWRMESINFVPTNALETLDLLTDRGEVWVDTVSIETSGDIFVLPEEPLDILDGERAMGEWRIEAQDTRTGAALPVGELLEWSLELTFGDTQNRATRMQNGSLEGPFTLRTNQVHYVVLDPCRSATFARFILRGAANPDALEVHADTSGFPTGNPETDDFLPMRNNQTNGSLTFELTRAMPAPARLNGKPIFLAIFNRFIDATNSYELEVISDGNCDPLTPPPELDPDDAPTPGTLDPDPGTGGNTNVNHGIFQFTVPPNVRAVTVTVVSDGDVAVSALKDEPPTAGLFSHFEDDVIGAGTEVLIIAGSNTPVPPGTWFVRLANKETRRVNYTVTVRFEFFMPAGEIRVEAFLVAGQVQLRWDSVPGATYEVQGSDVISPATWTLVEVVPAASTGTRTTYVVGSPTAGPRRYTFYRIMQRP
jgi:hypothetical protein